MAPLYNYCFQGISSMNKHTIEFEENVRRITLKECLRILQESRPKNKFQNESDVELYNPQIQKIHNVVTGCIGIIIFRLCNAIQIQFLW